MKNLEGEIDMSIVDELKSTAKWHYEDLNKIADNVKVLLENGWEGYGGLYDIHFYKDISKEDAEKELKELGLEEYIEYLEEPEWYDEE